METDVFFCCFQGNIQENKTYQLVVVFSTTSYFPILWQDVKSAWPLTLNSVQKHCLLVHYFIEGLVVEQLKYTHDTWLILIILFSVCRNCSSTIELYLMLDSKLAANAMHYCVVLILFFKFSP